MRDKLTFHCDRNYFKIPKLLHLISFRAYITWKLHNLQVQKNAVWCVDIFELRNTWCLSIYFDVWYYFEFILLFIGTNNRYSEGYPEQLELVEQRFFYFNFRFKIVCLLLRTNLWLSLSIHTLRKIIMCFLPIRGWILKEFCPFSKHSNSKCFL